MGMEIHGGMMLTGEDQSTLWQSYQQSHLVANEEERKRILLIFSVKYLFHTHGVL
jgi:hypothetical protein